tara:strand:+ start:83 stop:271 length:189 start_codon:yes stop_codon:yes gene_type:complete
MLGSKWDRFTDNNWKLTKYISKWVLVMMAFIISSVFVNDDMMWMCIWCLSIIKLVELTDEKI